MLSNWIFDCPAYRALHPVSRTLLWELVRRYNGSNNGEIGLGVREAAKACSVKCPDTMSKYFEDLQLKGFIDATRRGGFNMKDPSSRRATEWRLTWIDAPGLRATKRFLQTKSP